MERRKKRRREKKGEGEGRRKERGNAGGGRGGGGGGGVAARPGESYSRHQRLCRMAGRLQRAGWPQQAGRPGHKNRSSQDSRHTAASSLCLLCVVCSLFSGLLLAGAVACSLPSKRVPCTPQGGLDKAYIRRRASGFVMSEEWPPLYAGSGSGGHAKRAGSQASRGPLCAKVAGILSGMPNS